MISNIDSPPQKAGSRRPPRPQRVTWWLAVSVCCVLLCAPPPTLGASQVAGHRWVDVDKVVAFGDVHGAYPALLTLLTSLDLIDSQQRWTGGETHLVSLGDLLDRGGQSRPAMDLLMALTPQAEAAGGRVHMVLGNHEVMNLTGDLRYVAAGEYEAFAAEETPAQREAGLAAWRQANPEAPEGDPFPPGFFAHRAAFSVQGEYGRWLLTLPTVLIINNMAFTHGGFPPWMNELDIEAINRSVQEDLHVLLTRGARLMDAGTIGIDRDLLDPDLQLADEDSRFSAARQSRLLGEGGPFWYRGTAHCHQVIETPRVAAALAHFNVDHLVLGHSPTTTRRIQQRFDHQVILADTGMLTSYYRGQPTALIVEQGEMQFAYPEEEQITRKVSPPPSDLRVQPLEAELEQKLMALDLASVTAGSPTPVSLDGVTYQVLWKQGSKRQNAVRVAAYRLDRLLGLGMAPPTVLRKARGRSGTLALLPARTLSEADRLSGNIYRPNWCAPSSDFQLMYAFDALTGNQQRTPDSMIYHRANWSLTTLLDNQAFGTSASLPDYLRQVRHELPEGLADLLEAMDVEVLESALGDLLSERQISAIDKRRLRLLQDWQGGR